MHFETLYNFLPDAFQTGGGGGSGSANWPGHSLDAIIIIMKKMLQKKGWVAVAAWRSINNNPLK